MFKPNFYRLLLFALFFINSADIHALLNSNNTYTEQNSVPPSGSSITPQPQNWHFSSDNNTSIPLSPLLSDNFTNTFTINTSIIPPTNPSGQVNDSNSLPPVVPHGSITSTSDNISIIQQSLFPPVSLQPQSSAAPPPPNYNESTNTFIPPLMLSGWCFNNSTNTFDINNRNDNLIAKHVTNFPNNNNLLISNDSQASNTNSSVTLHPQQISGTKQDKSDKKSTKTYTCPTCHKNLANQSSLNYHVKTHDPNRERPFKCNLCSKSYTKKSTLTKHIKTHSGKKPYKCNGCPQSFKSKEGLKKHIKRVHNKEMPYTCDVCNKSFVTNSEKRRHAITHTGEKPYTCDICQKGLSSKSALKDHLKMHLKKKPHKCTQCTKAYTSTHALKWHLKEHKKGSYTCSYCSASFTYKSEYENHMKYENSKHEDRKCHICKKVYADKYKLKRHNKKLHPEK